MEMKFYRKIGVLQWKKFVLWLMSKFIRDPEMRKGGNYYLRRISLSAVKDFKKALWFNGTIHAIGLLNCILVIANDIFANNIISSSMLINTICFFINLYCVMLQRYNWLRIKKVLNKVALK